MTKHILLSTLLFSSLIVSVSFADTQTITLNDGSQVKGELVGINNGVYTIHTSNLGDVNVKTSEVANIGSGTSAPLQQPPMGYQPSQPANLNTPDFNQKLQSAQSRLMNDPAMMQQVQAMAQDPELMKLLSDPELVRAVTNHDANAIANNPRAQELMNNPKMRALMDQLQSSGGGQ